MTIQCSNCKMPLEGGLDTFGSLDFPLCWYCHSQFLRDDETDFYDERTRVRQLQTQYAGNCPQCQSRLEVGVADYSIGRTCPVCGYHDVTFLEQEV